MNTKAFISGFSGLELTADEKAFFKDENPWGFIIFARNVDSPEQLAKLCDSLKQVSQRDNVPILVDQEGGRVQRLRPPYWTKYPAARTLGALFEEDEAKGKRAVWLMSRLHAFDLLKLGLTVDCLPVIDVPSPDGHDVIGDRAYGRAVEQVSALGEEACEGLMAGGVMPVIKHIPGHGRATADSHHDLPFVSTPRDELEKTDFKPFKDLSHIHMAMTAHVIYEDIDPKECATTSKIVMDEIVRGYMGYDGLIMSDDLMMGALSGDLKHRVQSFYQAGGDMALHCSGKMDEMKQVAEMALPVAGQIAERAHRACQSIGVTDHLNEEDCRSEFLDLMGQILMANTRDQKADPTNYGKTA